MRGVECGPDRCPVAPDSLRRADRRAWSFEYDGIEFVVGGSPRGPRPDRLELAERVAAHIKAFEAEANEYLVSFVGSNVADFSLLWEVVGIDLGPNPSDPADEFEVVLLRADDTYGQWAVRFRSAGPLNRFLPIEFRRRQI